MKTKTPTVHRLKFEGRDIEVVETQTDLDNEQHRAIRHVNTCPLDTAYFKNGWIDEVGHQAGTAFHANWRRVQVGSDKVPDLDRVPGENGNGTNEGEMRAREWLKDVHRNLRPRDWEMLILICGEEQTFEDARNTLNSMPFIGRKLHKNYMAPRFAEACESLAIHMGLTQGARYVTERN